MLGLLQELDRDPGSPKRALFLALCLAIGRRPDPVDQYHEAMGVVAAHEARGRTTELGLRLRADKRRGAERN
jgi:hypothetical protein